LSDKKKIVFNFGEGLQDVPWVQTIGLNFVEIFSKTLMLWGFRQDYNVLHVHSQEFQEMRKSHGCSASVWVILGVQDWFALLKTTRKESQVLLSPAGTISTRPGALAFMGGEGKPSISSNCCGLAAELWYSINTQTLKYVHTLYTRNSTSGNLT
jgi:hypothetical protein